MINYNPYKNTANFLVKEKKLRDVIKHLSDKYNITEEDLDILNSYIELQKHKAFDEGMVSGKYDTSLKLREILNAEIPHHFKISSHTFG